MTKRVLAIEGYNITPASRSDLRTIMVLTNDNCVTEFEDLNKAQYPVLISAFEADENVEAFVVADNKGAYAGFIVRDSEGGRANEDL